MKRTVQLAIPVATLLAMHIPAGYGQLFDSGSDGSLGPLVVIGQPQILNIPSNGVFNFTTITVNQGQTLRFNGNALNTPVYLLATGDVVINVNSEIQVDGSNGNQSANTDGGAGGAGGFDGGRAGADGQGPGAGRAGGTGTGESSAGGGSYGTESGSSSTNRGSAYGSPLLVPLVGGSGGGGAPDGGGGGGGGAILIASSTRIVHNGTIRARGGSGRGFTDNNGSGGAIRLVAPAVIGGGGFDISGSGKGRVRVDSMDRTGLSLGGTYSLGSFMTVFPPGNPRLDITQAAGTVIPEGTNTPVTVSLPFGSSTNRTVTVQARNFGEVVPIELALVSEIGQTVRIQTNIDNTTVNPATVTVPVAFQINTPTTVKAWTR
jgi:hypothetical protein